jgi:hypothetical protein
MRIVRLFLVKYNAHRTFFSRVKYKADRTENDMISSYCMHALASFGAFFKTHPLPPVPVNYSPGTREAWYKMVVNEAATRALQEVRKQLNSQLDGFKGLLMPGPDTAFTQWRVDTEVVLDQTPSVRAPS